MKNLNLFIADKATVSATAFVPFPALENARQTATAHKAKIGSTTEGWFKADCSTAKIANAIADKLNADYADAVAQKTKSSKPTSAKGKSTNTVTVVLNGVEYKVNKSDLVPTQAPKTPSSTKKTTKKETTKKTSSSPRKAKGNAFDYSVIKGKTTSDKNKALHKFLVKMGIKDSRTPEYMSVWNARPWAK